MTRFLSHPMFLWGSRWLLGAVFLVAAWYKITDLVDFAQNISNYDMIPLALLPAFATLLHSSQTRAPSQRPSQHQPKVPS